MSKQISIVIPLLNEEESLPELFAWIQKVLSENYTYEVIFIDDGSKDKSWEVIEGLQKKHSEVRGIKFQRNYGKSAALQKGFEMCEGESQQINLVADDSYSYFWTPTTNISNPNVDPIPSTVLVSKLCDGIYWTPVRLVTSSISNACRRQSNLGS